MADEYLKAALYWISNFNKKAKEEIWIIKLLDLLNEYDGRNHWWDYDEEDLDINAEDNSVLEIISKQFWFIKWLVENEKIDLENIKETFYVRSFQKDWTAIKYEYYEELLMLLSIQDEPLKFLISILKNV